jgi:hypothetical protein
LVEASDEVLVGMGTGELVDGVAFAITEVEHDAVSVGDLHLVDSSIPVARRTVSDRA